MPRTRAGKGPIGLGLLRRSVLLSDFDGSSSNLSMLLRSHTPADFTSAHEVPAVRLPFPRHSEGAAGQNLQAPRVFAKTGDGRRDSG